MLCPKCSTNIDEGSAVCANCGASLLNSPEPLPTEGKPTASSDEPTVLSDEMETIASAAPDATPGTPSPSQMIAGRYEILRELGQGGFAVVYQARDTRLGRIVAIKRLLAERLQGQEGAEAIQRFLRESVAIARLNHRNIVHVFDTDHDELGHYIVLECIDGGSLHEYLREKGKLPVPEAVKLLEGVARGLSYAHRRKLIHRDIKPGNIMLSRDDGEIVPRIVDFGLARIGTESTLSMSGYGMGTPSYMPPEQRADAKSVDQTADIYALGKMLYELVTGDRPDNVHPARIPPPPALSHIIFKCVETRPEDRYSSVDALLSELAPLLTAEGTAQLGTPVAPGTSPHACPACGRPHAREALFCEHCGAGLTEECPECGRQNPMAAQFCANCGTDVKQFAELQQLLQTCRELIDEKRWDQALAQLATLPAALNLGGESGQELQQQLQDVREQVVAAVERKRLLRIQIEERVESQDYSDALRLAQECQELDPHSQETASRLQTLIEPNRAHIFLDTYAEFCQLLAARRLNEARTRASELRELASGLSDTDQFVFELEDDDGQTTKQSVSELLEAMHKYEADISACEREADAIIDRAEKLARADRWEQALDLLRQADEIYPDRERAKALSQHVQSNIQTENDGVEWLKTQAAAARAQLDDRRLQDCAATIEAARAKCDELRPREKSEAMDAWREACGELDDLEECLQARERRLAELLQTAGERFGKHDYEGCMQACVTARALTVEDTVATQLLAETEAVLADIKHLLQTAQGNIASRQWSAAKAACRNVLEQQAGNAAAEQLLARIGLEERAFRTRRVRLCAATALAAIFTVALAYGGVVFRRAMQKKTFEAARQAGRTSEAARVAMQIAHRYEPAQRFLDTCLVKGRPWRVPELDLPMVWVPPGKSVLGSTNEQRQWTVSQEGQCGEWINDEGAEPRQVQLLNGFWLGQTEVTVAQWRQFADQTSYKTEAEKRGEAWGFDWQKRTWTWVKGVSWRDPGYGFKLQDRHPVACVTWNDAGAFLEWLTNRERQQERLTTEYEYRLPTEWEWEYACRAGRDNTKFWWGDTLQDGQGRLNASSDDSLGHACPTGRWSGRVPWSDGFAWASPADNYGDAGRNAFGLADMLGNVAEWCYDHYDPKQAHETAWGGDSPLRVVRGGSFDSCPGFMRCAARNRFAPTRADAHQGFRACLGPAIAVEQ